MRTLSAHRQTLAVSQATIGADLHKTLDVLAYLTTEVTLDLEVPVNILTKTNSLLFCEILDTGIRVDAGFLQNLGSGGQADTVDVSQANLNALLTREIDTRNAGQSNSLLALTLLMARVLANNEYAAMASDDLALVTHLLDRRTDFHKDIPFSFLLFNLSMRRSRRRGLSYRTHFKQPVIYNGR